LAKKTTFSGASVDVVCFDLSETLVAWNDAFDASLREAAGEWAGRWSEGGRRAEWQGELSRAFWNARKQGKARTDAIREALSVLPIDTDERIIAQVSRTARRLQPLRCGYAAGAEAALAKLSPHYRLAVMTNLDEERALQVWKRLKLDRFMKEEDLFYGTDSARKPNRRMYRTAAARLGVPASRCLMVGNSYRNDCIGAVRAGWKAVWIKKGVRPSAKKRGRGERPVMMIPSVGLLPRLLRGTEMKRLESRPRR
jgi:FMN phosphatase YigB (HAD superfamily)